MKVILLQDVAKIGHRYDVVEVPHGYALNRLIPQKLAEEATEHNVKRIESRAQKIESKRIASGEEFDAALKKLEGVNITIDVEANDAGHMFEALKAERIAEALEHMGIVITAEQLLIDTPIKSVGEHTIRAVSGDRQGEVTLTVVKR